MIGNWLQSSTCPTSNNPWAGGALHVSLWTSRLQLPFLRWRKLIAPCSMTENQRWYNEAPLTLLNQRCLLRFVSKIKYLLYCYLSGVILLKLLQTSLPCSCRLEWSCLILLVPTAHASFLYYTLLESLKHDCKLPDPSPTTTANSLPLQFPSYP